MWYNVIWGFFGKWRYCMIRCQHLRTRMKRNKMYRAFWIPIPMTILLGVIFDLPIDVPLHDTYFITSGLCFSILISLFLFLSGIGYYVHQNRTINVGLVKGHVGLTFLGVLIIVISLVVPAPVYDFWSYQERVQLASLAKALSFLFGLVLILIGIGCYLVNMIAAMFNLR